MGISTEINYYVIAEKDHIFELQKLRSETKESFHTNEKAILDKNAAFADKLNNGEDRSLVEFTSAESIFNTWVHSIKRLKN